MSSIFNDKILLRLNFASLLVSLVVFLTLWYFLVKDQVAWNTVMFIPIYIYVIIVFVLNFILSLISYKRNRLISIFFPFITISINILIISALIFNIKNLNG